jgi:hypothetical protein
VKRQVILQATADVLTPKGYRDPGTSLYPWANTPSLSLAETWNDELNSSYAYSWPTTGPRHAVSFEKGPTLARFNKVTIVTGFDYSQSGPNNWWFPPDNAHGPGCAIMIRNRAGDDWIVGTGAAAYQIVGGVGDYNVNILTNPGVFKLYTLTWEMAAHPEGGPWTLDDINELAAGVEFNWAVGPNGKAYDESQGSFFKIRAPYLTVTLDIEDLGGSIENVRESASMTLRLMRRARNAIGPSVRADHAVGQVGSRVYFSHPQGPAVGSRGWGAKRLERRAGFVLKRTILPETLQLTDEVLDLRPFACLGWAAYRIDGPWSPELQGLALLDKGKSFTHDRTQDAWSQRPGDGVLVRVLEDYPTLSTEGLAISGGDDVAIALYNYDLMQSGWSTVADTGDFDATTDTSSVMAEEQGYLSSCLLSYGAAGATGGRERSLGTLPYASGDRIHVRVILKNTSVPDPDTQCGECYLKRSGGGLAADEFWSESAREWTTTPTYLAIPSSEPSGELVLDAIPCDAAGATSDPTYAIGVGRFSSSMASVTLNGAIVDVQHSDSTVAGARPPIVTLGATIARLADSHLMPQVWGRELWAHERGTAVCEVRPWWRAELLPAAAVKPLLHAQHATDTHDALQFVAKTGSDDVIRFERAIAGEATYQLDCPIPSLDLNRTHVLRAWVRWLGADGWTEYGPYSVEVGYGVFLVSDGSLVSQGSVVGRLSSEVAVPYERESLGIGCDGTRQLDGWVRTWETRRNPLHRLECLWRV